MEKKRNSFRDKKSDHPNKYGEPLEPKIVTTKSLTVAKKVSAEMKMVGINACLAAFKARPQDIVRVYVESNKIKIFSKILKHCSDKKIAYKILPQEDIDKITETAHNEGVCFIVRKRELFNFKKFLSNIPANAKHSSVVALEDVQNPHNIGAILRVCANFGVDGLLLEEPQLTQSGAVFRTAEGGAEHVQILETGELLKALEEFKRKGFKVYGTSSHGGQSLAKTQFHEKCVLLFGSESEGLSKNLLKICDETICIPQSGHVESLNVSCAASVILYEQFKKITP
jgi:TrmH RNA methyltransferase